MPGLQLLLLVILALVVAEATHQVDHQVQHLLIVWVKVEIVEQQDQGLAYFIQGQLFLVGLDEELHFIEVGHWGLVVFGLLLDLLLELLRLLVLAFRLHAQPVNVAPVPGGIHVRVELLQRVVDRDIFEIDAILVQGYQRLVCQLRFLIEIDCDGGSKLLHVPVHNTQLFQPDSYHLLGEIDLIVVAVDCYSLQEGLEDDEHVVDFMDIHVGFIVEEFVAVVVEELGGCFAIRLKVSAEILKG